MMRRLFLAMCLGLDAEDLRPRLNRFAAAYNEFIEEQQHGIFSVRHARELSRLWHEIETSGDWPQ